MNNKFVPSNIRINEYREINFVIPEDLTSKDMQWREYGYIYDNIFYPYFMIFDELHKVKYVSKKIFREDKKCIICKDIFTPKNGKQVACITFEEIRQMIVKGEIYVGVPMAIIGRYFLTLYFSR